MAKKKNNEKANQALQNAIEKAASIDFNAIKIKFSKSDIERKTKDITYTIKENVGFNFYAYEWYTESSGHITDVGCDNYKDYECGDAVYTTFFENGYKQTYKENVDTIKNALKKTKSEINRVLEAQAAVSRDLKQLSNELSEINIPNINLGQRYQKFDANFNEIAKNLKKLEEKI